jgi:hypothetical protein
MTLNFRHTPCPLPTECWRKFEEGLILTMEWKAVAENQRLIKNSRSCYVLAILKVLLLLLLYYHYDYYITTYTVSATTVTITSSSGSSTSTVVPPYSLIQYPGFTTARKKNWKIKEINGS